jgi:hypothetical protein
MTTPQSNPSSGDASKIPPEVNLPEGYGPTETVEVVRGSGWFLPKRRPRR